METDAKSLYPHYCVMLVDSLKKFPRRSRGIRKRRATHTQTPQQCTKQRYSRDPGASEEGLDSRDDGGLPELWKKHILKNKSGRSKYRVTR